MPGAVDELGWEVLVHRLFHAADTHRVPDLTRNMALQMHELACAQSCWPATAPPARGPEEHPMTPENGSPSLEPGTEKHPLNIFCFPQ